MPTFNGINHLAMATGNMDETIRFWRDLLEMRLVAGLGKPGYRHYFFQISDTDLLAFFEWPDVTPSPNKTHGLPQKGPFIFDHISFGVETQEDLWEIAAKLDAAGFGVSDMIDHGFITSIYSHDPNGIPIEFSYAVKNIDIRHQPQMKDTEPTPAAQEGPDPKSGVWPEPESPIPESDRLVFPGAGSELFHGKK